MPVIVPPGWYAPAAFAAVARSLANPDWVAVTLHSHRARWDEAKPDPRSAALEREVKATKRLATPTLYLHGAVDGVNPPSTAAAMPAKFSGRFTMIELPGIGHFATREAPQGVAAALLTHFGR